jgi:putative heme-binding domain-containing protein
VQVGSVTADERNDWIDWGLQDESDQVLLAALRWATERDCKEHLTAIRELLDRPDLSAKVFSAVIASLAYLETGSAAGGRRDPARERMLYEFAADPILPAKLRSLAIRMLPSEADKPTDQQLGQWMVDQHDRTLALEAVRLLAARGTRPALEQLARIAADESLAVQTRADAAASLGRNAGEYAAVLNRLALPRQGEILRQEARRILRRTWQDDTASRPNRNDLDAWDKLVGSGGDIAAGRRVFFRTTCANCHAHSGRGAKTGPDLTTLSGQMTSKRLIESILEPSKEIGPLYVPWRVLTVDGHVLTGLKLDASGVGNSLRFQGADGMTFEVPLGDIVTQDPIAQSIMPAGLEDAMSIDELRDLIAFLVGTK